MTTRRSLKCHLTGVTLEPSEAVQTDLGSEHFIFHQEWKNFTTGIANQATDEQKSAFIEKEWDRMLNHIMFGPEVTVTNYFKFLISWCILSDPSLAFHLLCESLSKCSSNQDLQHYVALFTAILKVMVGSPSVSTILNDIDELKSRILEN